MITVYDNAINQELLTKLQEIVMSDEMPWFYTPSSAYGTIVDEGVSQGSLYHLASSPNTRPSFLYPICKEVSNQCLSLVEGDYNIIRARLALQMWKGLEHITHSAHVDSEQEHLVGLLYLNDSDGDTTLYDQEYEWGTPSAPPKVLTKKSEVHPRANRLVIFDGYHYHSSSAPTNYPSRYVINFNWVKEK